MCGIAGVIARDPAVVSEGTLGRMMAALHHRGPDARALWRSPRGDVGFVHTRLSILDLSPGGAQPMSTADRRFTIAFNGEIYNYLELRETLEKRGVRFRGSSDTEVLLQLFAERGEGCLELLDGMFAFAVHDERTGEVFCARDRLGEKPLYYVARAGLFAFASEVRALVASGIVDGSPDLRGLGLLLRQGSIPPPYTHVRDVHFLEPGSFVRVRAGGADVARSRYWKLPIANESGDATPEQEIDRIHDELRTSIARRLRSDVPLACFLSGGIDSSLITAIAAQQHSALHTFTVSLPGQPGDEGAFARAFADHLGVHHTEVTLELDAKGDWLEHALEAMDVPSIDGPNTWVVARAVREAGFKVALSGLGGDELFFGYPSFKLIPRAAPWARPARPLSLVRPFGRRLAARVPAPPRFGRVVDAFAAGGTVAALWFAKRGLFSEHEVRELLTEAAYAEASAVDPIARVETIAAGHEQPVERAVSALELGVYMHDQLLRDTDAMSMAHALEVRVPFLAHTLVELATRTRASTLIGSRPKAVLRALHRRYYGREDTQPKRGFTLNWTELLARRAPQAPDAALIDAANYHRELDRFSLGRVGFARRIALEAWAISHRGVDSIPASPGGASASATAESVP